MREVLSHHIGDTNVVYTLCRSVAPSYVASTIQNWDYDAFGHRRGANWSGDRSSGAQLAW